MSKQLLFWDSAFAVANALIDQYPERDPNKTGLAELQTLVSELDGFADDIEIVSEEQLNDILMIWYEESLQNDIS